MYKNILLMFLSDIKTRNGEIQKTHYTNLDGEDTHTTNESAVRYILQNDSAGLSKIFILASKTVRENIQGYSDEITHLEYFKNRLKNFLPVENCITEETIQEYNEDNNGTENLKSVAEMAQKIQNFAEKNQDEIILHTDLTGGMRHINMMMLDIIRLLEYSGVKIGKIIYSNYNPQKKLGTVEEVKNIYDLFQLISGVEEFINFGSIKVLKDYYKNHSEIISVALKNLLDAMENFAEAIKLCRYGQFKFAIAKLHDAINDFSPDENNLNDILMARLIERIKQEYEMLISTRGQDDLKIIRWCINKGYLQQALTLYTERIPEYIGENFISMTGDEEEKLHKNMKGDLRNKFFYLLNNYLSESPEFLNYKTNLQNKIDDVNKKVFTSIKNDAIKNIRSGNFDYKTFCEKIFTEIDLPKDLLSIKNLFDEAEFHSRFNVLNELKQNLIDFSSPRLEPFKKIINDLNLNPSEQQSKRVKIFLNSLTQLNVRQLKKLFPAFELNVKILRLQFMLENKIFYVRMSPPDLLNIMEKYFILKDERNHANHARNDIGAFETAADLEKFMLDGLDEIENIMEE